MYMYIIHGTCIQYITVTFNVHAYNTHRYMYMCMVVRSACTVYKGIMIMQLLHAVINVSYGVVYERGLVNEERL